MRVERRERCPCCRDLAAIFFLFWCVNVNNSWPSCKSLLYGYIWPCKIFSLAQSSIRVRRVFKMFTNLICRYWRREETPPPSSQPPDEVQGMKYFKPCRSRWVYRYSSHNYIQTLLWINDRAIYMQVHVLTAVRMRCAYTIVYNTVIIDTKYKVCLENLLQIQVSFLVSF